MTPFQPLHLPNGSVIPNRIAKAAMEENLANPDQTLPTSCCAFTRLGPRAVPGCC